MVEGFEKLDSTQVGVAAEKVFQRFIESRGWTIDVAPNVKEWDNTRDFEVFKEGVRRSVEVKGDNYPRGKNIVFEYRQQGINGDMKPSGMSVTEAEYVAYYVFRWSKLYIYKTQTYNHYIEEGHISEKDSKPCNINSSTGKTECYLIDINLLEADGFFCQIVEDVQV